MPTLFEVPAPSRLLVADFTYVKLVTGVLVCVAFGIDAFANSAVGTVMDRSSAAEICLVGRFEGRTD